ncbi:hypothetical protein OIV83_000018 [Microbotryomycetes sp. JL201]|nr:hypothetical protein OIV83_000018 [Microbotryomycetes sp. JL201]
MSALHDLAATSDHLLEFLDFRSHTTNGILFSASKATLRLLRRRLFLRENHVPPATSAQLQQILDNAEITLTEQHCLRYGKTIEALAMFLDSGKLRFAQQALQEAYQHAYNSATKQVCEELHQALEQARRRHDEQIALAATIPRVPDCSYGTFSEEVTAILLQAYSHQQTVTKAERRVLSDVTGLSDRQIRTWFGNQRQRRGMSQQPQKPYSARRGAPYTKTRPDASKFSLRSPMRNFSGASSSSLGSDASDVSEASTAASSVQSWLESKANGYGLHSPPQQLAQVDSFARYHTEQLAAYSTVDQWQQHAQYSPALQITIDCPDAQPQARYAGGDEFVEHTASYCPPVYHSGALEEHHQQAISAIEQQDWQEPQQTDPAYVPLLPNFDFEAEARDNDFWQAFTQGDGLNELFGAIAASTNGVAIFPVPQTGENVSVQDVSGINLMLPLNEASGIGGFWRQ